VKDVLLKLDQVLRAASFEQRKTLLHMMIGKITVDKARKIEHIEMKLGHVDAQGNVERQGLLI
jgi:hypothetical protein